MAAIAAHLAPAATFFFARDAGAQILLLVGPVTFAAFAAAWRQMLKNGKPDAA